MWLAWTGLLTLPAPLASLAALLALLALLAPKVLFNAAQKVKCHKEVRLGVVSRSVNFNVQSVILQKYLVGHFKV